MKKGFVLGLILAAVLLTGCLPTSQKETTERDGSKGDGSSKQEKSYSGNMEKMMGLGMPLKCSWKKDDSYYGESWVKGKKYYQEVHQEGKTAKVIFKDDCMWAWEETNSQGTKMCFEPEEMETMESGIEGTGQGEGNFQYQQSDIEYQCRPGVFGDDKFNPPANVNFMDIGQMMENMGQ